MARVKNPFIVTGKIEKEYFCDRVVESKAIEKAISNGNNLVLISPRRMGKTGLVRYCYDFNVWINAVIIFLLLGNTVS